MSENPGLKDSSCAIEGNTVVFRITSPVDDNLGSELETRGRTFLESGASDRVLIDLRGSSTFSVRARMHWVNFLKHPRIAKAAIFGGSPVVRVIAMIMISLSKRQNIKYFSSEDEARGWL